MYVNECNDIILRKKKEPAEESKQAENQQPVEEGQRAEAQQSPDDGQAATDTQMEEVN